MTQYDVSRWSDALGRVSSLTPREYQLFLLLQSGSSNQELADELFVTERTVRAHLTQIATKLQVPSRLRLGLVSYAHGLRGSGEDLSTPPDRRVRQ